MTIPLTPDSIDDLIYDARAGDLDALKSDIATLSTQHACPEAVVVALAVDTEDEAEGGTGCCLLHFPAANGNVEILNYLLQTLKTQPEQQQQQQQQQQQTQTIVNHRNLSGNTALHWAALNTHLECVKALVEAGADISIKNDAGLDPVFLAERTAWSNGELKDEEVSAEAGGENETETAAGTTGEVSKGRQVVEWLLSRGEELENGAGESSGAGEGEAAEGGEKK